MRCPDANGADDYDENGPCTFTRKLCVTCAENAGTVYITVQSNGLPNHCFTSTVNNPTSMEREWSVVFNADVTDVQNYTETDFDTSAKADELLCDLQRTSSSNMLDLVDYTITDSRRRLQPPPCHPNCTGPGPDDGGNSGGGGGAEALGTAAGIGLSGAYIFNALDGNNTDAVESEGDTLDVCLNHPTPSSEFHYHYWGACLVKDYGYWSDTDAPSLCRDAADDACLTATDDFTIAAADASAGSFYTADNWDGPIGLARDGHIILGPYKSDGTRYGCDDRDQCNGAFVGDDADVYAYVGSGEFPYVVGCWGPGPAATVAPSCSNNACGVAVDGDETADDDSNDTDESNDTDDTDVDGDSASSLAISAAAATFAAISLF